MDEEIWEARQAEKQASYEAGMRALASGEKTALQIICANSCFDDDAARQPLPWDEILCGAD